MHRNATGYQPQRSSTLGEDSFIFNDDDGDAGAEYFGVDSDEEDAGDFLHGVAAAERGAPRTSAAKASAARPTQHARGRPTSAPSISSTSVPVKSANEWWKAESSSVAPVVDPKDGYWAKDTLRRLHLEQLENLREIEGASGGTKARTPAEVATADALAKRRGSV